MAVKLIDFGYLSLFYLLALATPREALVRPSSTRVHVGGITHLATDTPIATSGETIYAVSQSGDTVLERTTTTLQWIPIETRQHFGHISGLTASGDSLFVVDAAAPAVYAISLPGNNTQTLYAGPPLQQPSEISVVGDHVYILDRAEPTLFDLYQGELTRVQFRNGLPITRQAFLGSFEQDLVVTEPDQGVILILSHPASLAQARLTEIVCKDPRCMTSSNKSTMGPLTDVLPQTEKIDRIRRPGALALANGIIYFVDRGNRSIVASSSRIFRPVDLSFSDNPIKNPSRIALTPKSIIIVDTSVNDLVIWPLLVPVEIVVDVQTSESLSAIYTYLYNNKILPTKVTSLDDSMEKTLRKERVLLSPYVSSLDPVICGLNPTLCRNGSVKLSLRDHTPVVVPDLYSESYVDARLLKLDGTHTLKYEVERRIRSPELALWKTEQKLRAMNPQFKHRMLPIRHEKKGTFIAPVELVRYVAAVPARDLDGSTSELASVLSRNRQSISVHSLQEIQAVPQQTDITGLLVKKDKASFQDAYKRMLRTINYIHPNEFVLTPYVGVAEKVIDCDNPDFEQVVCLQPADELESIPQSVSTAAIQKPSDRFRDFDDLDHGTAVAAIIGAHRTDFSGQGLGAPETRVIPLSTEDSTLGEDIRKAYTIHDARIFNLSLSFKEGRTPKILAKYMSAGSQSAAAYNKYALFIISAPDDGKAVCGDRMVYPICWGLQPNVLVVAASLIDGSALIPNAGGSNWGKAYVHVAAPGIGFGVSARNRSYVPVAGTSFAAPLVTATAALLYKQNVLNPVLIKQRIIATSSPMPGYEEKMVGGLLNVRLAVSHPGRGLLVDDAGKEKVVEIVPGQSLYVVWSSGRLWLPLKNILRLTRTDDGFRIVYQDPSDRTQLQIKDQVSFDAKRPWKIRYSLVGGDGTGVQVNTTQELLSDYKDYVGPIL